MLNEILSGDAFFALLSITLLFIVLLILRHTFKWEWICAICGSVSLTWILLYLLYYLEEYFNGTIIAFLVGNSVTGIYYLIDSKIGEKYGLFRLPLLLTLLFIGFVIIQVEEVIPSLLLIIVVWLILLLVWLAASRHNKDTSSS